MLELATHGVLACRDVCQPILIHCTADRRDAPHKWPPLGDTALMPAWGAGWLACAAAVQRSVIAEAC